MKYEKRVLTWFVTLALSMTMLAGCASDKTINSVHCETYGLFNRDEVRRDDVEYKLVVGNVVWGVLLFQTVIAPVYFFGFSLYEPVGAIRADAD